MLRLCLDACIWYQPKYATCAHAVEQNRVDGVMADTGCDDDSQRRRDACFFKQRSAWQRWVFDGPTTARRASRAVNL